MQSSREHPISHGCYGIAMVAPVLGHLPCLSGTTVWRPLLSLVDPMLFSPFSVSIRHAQDTFLVRLCLRQTLRSSFAMFLSCRVADCDPITFP